MERLQGFNFGDVAGMKDAGVDTHEVVRTGMIGFMEGAMIHGIFHGDLHGGNLFVLPDGRTALLDLGITGRLSEPKRLAFLRLLIGSLGQRHHRADGGAPRTSARQAGRHRHPSRDPSSLNLDGPVVDPTQLTGDEMVGEIQKTIKALLGFGARMPKELMLFVKNMVFLDGAIATLAPDLDIIGEIAHVAETIAVKHGEPDRRSARASTRTSRSRPT